MHLVTDILGCKEIASTPYRKQDSTSNPESNKKFIEARRQWLNKIWNEAREVAAGDPVYNYLTITRQLLLSEIPPVLRTHPGLPYYNEDNKCLGNFPVMLARIENIAGELVSLHRTYLTPAGQKAFNDKSKKLMPPIYERATTGAAIRLYQPTDTLILAEGIETALYGALSLESPAWACISDHGLANVVVPPEVHKVIALVDNDEGGAGQRASEKLAIRMKREGRPVKRLMPEQLGKDWLDVDMQEVKL